MDLSALRSVIDEQLQTDEVYERIAHALQNVPNGTPAAEAAALDDAGLIDDVIRAIDERRPGASSSTGSCGGGQVRTFLRMKVQRGSAFASSHAVSSGSDVNGGSDPTSFLQLHIAFRNQRFRSEAVACAVDPAFDETFLLEMQQPAAKSTATTRDDLRSLLYETPSPSVHVVLLRLTPEPGSLNLDTARRQLIAVHAVDWRRSLSRGSVALPVELLAAGAQAKVPVGILHLRFDLLPAPRHGHAVPAAEITQALQSSARNVMDAQRQFYQYARAWWSQFCEAGPRHQDRPVKIFAMNEHGEHRAVCSYVSPLRPGRCLNIDTPRHAARFVSLLPFERAQAVGGGRLEVWHYMHTLLARGRGDVEEHAVLLASLLLGFGLDAYVVMGTADDGVHDAPVAHAWVMTRSTGGGGEDNEGGLSSVTFWESLKGERWAQRPMDQVSATHPYRTVGCVFNHHAFYGNLQKVEDASACSFEFEDQASWKAMDGALLSQLPHQAVVSLLPTELEPRIREASIEQELRLGVERIRHEQQLPLPIWDEELSYVLSPALAAYETERTLGVSAGNAEFQSAIKRAVPHGQCFKGFPTAFAHMSVSRMLASFSRSDVPRDILATRGSGVRFSLRVKLVAFPENVVVVWVMLAVRFIAV